MTLALGFGGGQAVAKTFLPLDPCEQIVQKNRRPECFQSSNDLATHDVVLDKLCLRSLLHLLGDQKHVMSH
jgi:hypothetical protein